jgi:protein-tyrosine phosphatase
VQSRTVRRQPGLAISPRAESVPLSRASRGAGRRLGISNQLCAALDLLRQAAKPARHRTGMDITWLTDRIAVGGGIWTSENMAKVARAAVTHIIDMQIEFDDTRLGEKHGIVVLWNPTDDDFETKPATLFQRGVEFAQVALAEPETKLFIHCAAGVHRAPMMALAILGSMGWAIEDAMELIETRRPVVDFADVYVRSVEEFLAGDRSGERAR